MDQHFLDTVLTDCQENLDLSVQLLNALRLEATDPAHGYASVLVQCMSAVRTREEAEELATRAFQ